MFSKRCQYALHALACLARAEGMSLTTSQIVRERKLPRKFLEAILCELKEAGLVDSRKGKHGGYSLVKEPGEISIQQVVNTMEGDWFSCVHVENGYLCASCSVAERCIIDATLHSVQRYTTRWLSSHTILDLINKEEHGMLRHPLVKLLQA